MTRNLVRSIVVRIVGDLSRRLTKAVLDRLAPRAGSRGAARRGRTAQRDGAGGGPPGRRTKT